MSTMSNCERIIFMLLQGYLALQWIFILFCLTFIWQSDYEKKDICYLVLKAIQYPIHILFFKKKFESKKTIYHLCYYFIMDIYGVFLIELKARILWIILLQMLIGVIALGFILILLFSKTISGYFFNFFTCKQSIRLVEILKTYLIFFICITLISSNLFRYYEYSNFDFQYQIFRALQYIITFLFYRKEQYGMEVYQKQAFLLHQILDTLFNILGLLYIQYGSFFFWVIISQIALGCFHYCLILLNLVLFTITKYYQSICGYIYFRLTRLVSDNQVTQIKRFIIVYLIVQLVLTIYICIKHYQQQFEFNLPLSQLIYLFLRVIQYSFHLIANQYYEEFGQQFNYHFAFTFIIDVYGLVILNLQSQILWIIFSQIILGIAVYYLLCIEFVRMAEGLSSIKVIDCPLENLMIIVFMFELGFSILVFKFEENSDSLYLLFRIILYAISLLIIRLIEELDKELFKILCGFVLVLIIGMFGWGLKLLIFQGYVTFINLSQLLFDLILIGGVIFPYNENQDENLIQIWHIQKDYNLYTQYNYEIPQLLWWVD